MERFICTVGNKALLNLRDIRSITIISVGTDHCHTKGDDSTITESGIYANITTDSNVSKWTSIAGIDAINMVAEMDLDEEQLHEVSQPIKISSEFADLLEMIMIELKYELLLKESIINMWDVISDAITEYYNDVHKFKLDRLSIEQDAIIIKQWEERKNVSI